MHRTGYTLYGFIGRFDLDAVSKLLSNPDAMTRPPLAMNFLINYLAREFIFGRSTPIGSTHKNKDVCAFEAWIWASYLFYMCTCNKEYRATLGLPLNVNSTQPDRQKTFDLALVQGFADIQDFTGWEPASLWQTRFWSYMETVHTRRAGDNASLFDYIIRASVEADVPMSKYKSLKSNPLDMFAGLGDGDIDRFIDDNFGTLNKLVTIPEGCAKTYSNACQQYGWERI